MTYRRTLSCLIVGLALSGSTLLARADTIDNFTVPQGPITVGVGEEPSEEEGVIDAPDVLGGFRTFAPAVGDDAMPGSTITATIANGRADCVFEFPGVAIDNNGGCAIGWDRSDGPTFDLSNAGAIEFDVLESNPDFFIVVTLNDTNLVSAFSVLEAPEPGRYSLPISGFFSAVPTAPVDLTLIDSIVLVMGTDSATTTSATVTIGPVSTTGSIGGGPVVPVPEDVDKEDVSGTYFNAGRNGEGCQVTLEGDDQTIILTCYIFQGGEQAWIIGAGNFRDGEIDFDPMTITSGADFGDGFSASDVVRTRWGVAGMVWNDCNSATLTLLSELPGFPPINLELRKVTENDCAGSGPGQELLTNQGTMFNPSRDGEGLQIALQGSTDVYVVTWYTYLNGEQVWLIGTGVQTGNRIVFDELIITSGTGFGPNFNPANVVREPWGSLTLEFSDCNTAQATAVPLPGQPQFETFATQVQKLVPGACE